MLSVKRQASATDLQTNKRVQRSVPLEKSLGYCFPEIAKERHPTKNGHLTSYDVAAGSHQKVWWLCSKLEGGVCSEEGCRTVHEWEAVTKTRTQKNNGCALCANKGHTTVICKCKSLGFRFPSVAAELVDKSINTYTVSFSTNVVFAWRCTRNNGVCSECGTEHVYNVPVTSRTSSGQNCPWCAGEEEEE